MAIYSRISFLYFLWPAQTVMINKKNKKYNEMIEFLMNKPNLAL